MIATHPIGWLGSGVWWITLRPIQPPFGPIRYLAPPMSPRDLRNIGIIAHVDAGKTTLSERFLFFAGAIDWIGEVQEGQATMDFLREEQRRGITIRAGLASFRWNDVQVNFIDTPGHIDFGIEVERSLRVLDGAIAVFDGVRGVEPQSLAVWRQADRHGIPRIVWINKLDMPGADYAEVLADIEKTFAIPTVPVVAPLFDNGEPMGLVDLVEWKAYLPRQTDRRSPRVALDEVPFEWWDFAVPLREKLLDAVSYHSEAVTADLLAGRDPDPALIRRALALACQRRELVPACGGSAARNFGVEWVLDAIGHYLPAPQPLAGQENHPGIGLVFKSVRDPGNPEVALVRVYSGEFQLDQIVRKGIDAHEVRLTQIYSVFADRLVPIRRAQAGDIVAFEMQGDWRAGDTVISGGPLVQLETAASRDPVLEIVLESLDVEGAAKLEAAIRDLAAEDGSIDLRIDAGTGRWVVAGQGELQLDVLATRLRDEYECEIRTGLPMVRRREKISRRVQGFVDRTEYPLGVLQVVLEVEPGEGAATHVAWLEPSPGSTGAGEGLVRRREPELLRVLEAGVVEACGEGVLGAGSVVGTAWRLDFSASAGLEEIPLAWVKRLIDHAAREALRMAGTRVEVPGAKASIVVPEEFLGPVLNDLQSRGAVIQNVENQRHGAMIFASAPLANWLGYSTIIRSLSRGRANYTLELSDWMVASA